MQELEFPKNLKVNYHNNMNTINIPELSSQEMNVFYGICGKIKNEGDQVIKLSFSELRTLSGRSRNSPGDFEQFLLKLNDKLISINCKITQQHPERGKVIFTFNMFSVFKTYLDEEELELKVNDEFLYLLNELDSNYTSFLFFDFANLDRTYSKTLFRLLSQYKTTGYFKISVDKFRTLMSIPDSYKMKNISDKIINPSIDELSPYFENLKAEKQSNKSGKTITDLVFKFDKVGTKRIPKDKTTKFEDLTSEELELLKSKF